MEAYLDLEEEHRGEHAAIVAALTGGQGPTGRSVERTLIEMQDEDGQRVADRIVALAYRLVLPPEHVPAWDGPQTSSHRGSEVVSDQNPWG